MKIWFDYGSSHSAFAMFTLAVRGASVDTVLKLLEEAVLDIAAKIRRREYPFYPIVCPDDKLFIGGVSPRVGQSTAARILHEGDGFYELYVYVWDSNANVWDVTVDRRGDELLVTLSNEIGDEVPFVLFAHGIFRYLKEKLGDVRVEKVLVDYEEFDRRCIEDYGSCFSEEELKEVAEKILDEYFAEYYDMPVGEALRAISDVLNNKKRSQNSS